MKTNYFELLLKRDRPVFLSDLLLLSGLPVSTCMLMPGEHTLSTFDSANNNNNNNNVPQLVTS